MVRIRTLARIRTMNDNKGQKNVIECDCTAMSSVELEVIKNLTMHSCLKVNKL